MRFDLVQKFHSTIAELRCLLAKSKILLRKFGWTLEIKKLKSAFYAALLLVEKIMALCYAALLI